MLSSRFILTLVGSLCLAFTTDALRGRIALATFEANEKGRSDERSNNAHLITIAGQVGLESRGASQGSAGWVLGPNCASAEECSCLQICTGIGLTCDATSEYEMRSILNADQFDEDGPLQAVRDGLNDPAFECAGYGDDGYGPGLNENTHEVPICVAASEQTPCGNPFGTFNDRFRRICFCVAGPIANL